MAKLKLKSKFEYDVAKWLRSVKQKVRYEEIRIKYAVMRHRYYKPDLIINNSTVVELKCQHVGGSAKNKLSQAIAELSYIASERGYTPILVYTGKQLTDFVKVDPAFNKIRSIFHHVLVMDADQFIDYIKSGELETTNAYRFTSTHINDGYQN